MANYSLVINSQFKPYTFDELVKPYQMYGQAYREQEDALTELESKANIWERLANSAIDQDTYNVYKSYADDVRAQADQIAQRGLTPTSRQSVAQLRARYSSDITPIEAAYKAREEQAKEQQKALLQDPSLMFNRRASSTSLREYINNPQLEYSPASGKDIAARSSAMYSSIANEITEAKKSGQLDAYNNLFRKKYGITADEAMDYMRNPTKEGYQFLESIAQQAARESGVGDWGDEVSWNRALEWARSGVTSAVGKSDITSFTNQGAVASLNLRNQLELANRKAAAEKASKKRESASLIDRTSYFFSKDREKLQKLLGDSGELINPNKWGAASRYDLPKLIFDKQGKFSRPAKSASPYADASTQARNYYDTIQDILVNHGYSKESLSDMNKSQIENALQGIYNQNSSDLSGINLYRWKLDSDATKHILQGVASQGSALKEITGFKEGSLQYGDDIKAEYKDDTLGNIMYDPTNKVLMLQYEGKYYKLPEDRLSIDERNYIDQLLKAEQRLKQDKDVLISAGMGSLYEQRLLDIDSELGQIGERLTEYIGKKKLNS